MKINSLKVICFIAIIGSTCGVSEVILFSIFRKNFLLCSGVLITLITCVIISTQAFKEFKKMLREN